MQDHKYLKINEYLSSPKEASRSAEAAFLGASAMHDNSLATVATPNSFGVGHAIMTSARCSQKSKSYILKISFCIARLSS